MRVVVTRTEAKASGLTQYFTGKPCPYGHFATRKVTSRECTRCKSIRTSRKGKISADARSRKNRRSYESVRRRRPADRMLRGRLRSRLRDALRNKTCRVGSAVRDLDCSISEFRDFISAQFTDGMSWDNYGEWHLDHVRPLASFDLSDRGQFLEACHYTNYQPLWAFDNLVKGARVVRFAPR